jgi:transmembrane sensor
MPVREASTVIDAQAARWAARVDGAPLSAEEDAALDAWLAGDVRRVGAYAKARAVFAHVQRSKALGPNYEAGEFASAAQAPRGVSRRALWTGAAAAGVAGLSVTLGLQARAGVVRTKVGEVRLVPLPDGSSMTLNTASRARVSFSKAERRVHLLEGEAIFDVAKDPSRAFYVEAADTEVRAIGTSFVVCRLAAQPVQVLVRQGVVEVKRDAATAPPVRVTANSRAVSMQGGAIDAAAITPAEFSREIAWREGLLAFEDMPLEEAIAEYARYSDTRIVIVDPALRRETVTGLFMANNPAGFAQAVAGALDLKTEVSGREVRLYR